MKTKNNLSSLLRIVVAIILLQTLYFKFTAHPDSVLIFTALGAEPWGRIGLGIIELIVATMCLIPRTKIIGMISSLGIICGAIFSHILVLGINVAGDGGQLFLYAIIVFLCSVIYLLLNKADFIKLTSQLKNRIRHKTLFKSST